MLEHILVPLDGSMASAVALDAVIPLVVRRPEARITVLRVVEHDHGGLSDRELARDYVADVARGLEREGLRARGRVLDGRVAEAVLDLAAAERVGLIAMASHGRRGISRLALGSQTEKVLRASETPVLVVRSFGRARPLVGAPRHILVPIDGSDRALDVIPCVRSLQQLRAARVTLVHFTGPGRLALESVAGREYLRDAERAFEAAGVHTNSQLIGAEPAAGIVDYERPALDDGIPIDLVAMTTHGRSGLTRWTLGSITERVLRHASLPLLVVRTPAFSRRPLAPRERPVMEHRP